MAIFEHLYSFFPSNCSKFIIYLIVLYDEQLSEAVTSYCTICKDESYPVVDDDATVGRNSTAKYACVDCGGDRMCTDCACAHRKQRLSRGHRLVGLNGEGEATTSRVSSSVFCAVHPLQPVVIYCRDCEKALCERCGAVDGPNTGTCNHSACCDLSSAAYTGRACLEEDEQVVLIILQFVSFFGFLCNRLTSPELV